MNVAIKRIRFTWKRSLEKQIQTSTKSVVMLREEVGCLSSFWLKQSLHLWLCLIETVINQLEP